MHLSLNGALFLTLARQRKTELDSTKTRARRDKDGTKGPRRAQDWAKTGPRLDQDGTIKFGDTQLAQN